MDEPPARDAGVDQGLDRGLVFLKWLVIALTATMLVGMVTLITLFITRFPASTAPLPDEIDLPDGETAAAITFGRSFIAVVTEDDDILILSPDGQTVRQRIEVGE